MAEVVVVVPVRQVLELVVLGAPVETLTEEVKLEAGQE